MPGGQGCSVYGCKSTSSHTTISCHRFPKKESLRKRWVEFARAHRDGFYVSRTSVVCSGHFLPNDFENYTRFKLGFAKLLRLKRDAVPSVQKCDCQLTERSNDAVTADLKNVDTIVSEILQREAMMDDLATYDPSDGGGEVFRNILVDIGLISPCHDNNDYSVQECGSEKGFFAQPPDGASEIVDRSFCASDFVSAEMQENEMNSVNNESIFFSEVL